MTDFNSLIAEFGRQVRENLRVGDGEPEAQLTNPVATLLQDFGALHSMKVVTVRETSLKTAGGGAGFCGSGGLQFRHPGRWCFNRLRGAEGSG